MKNHLLFAMFVALSVSTPAAYGQKQPVAPASPGRQEPRITQARSTFDLAEYGVQIQPEPRLIVMMAALDAAGFDPTPAGKTISAFREKVRSDQALLDPDLRRRMRNFYERLKLPPPA